MTPTARKLILDISSKTHAKDLIPDDQTRELFVAYVLGYLLHSLSTMGPDAASIVAFENRTVN